jgi:hypothetical protein
MKDRFKLSVGIIVSHTTLDPGPHLLQPSIDDMKLAKQAMYLIDSNVNARDFTKLSNATKLRDR